MRVTKADLQEENKKLHTTIDNLLSDIKYLKKEVEMLRQTSPVYERNSIVMGAMSLNHTARDLIEAALKIARVK